VCPRTIDWLFRNRKTGAPTETSGFGGDRTGRITIDQFPNAALDLFLPASLLRRFVHGRLDDILGVLATGALIWWAVRGVNPWRRLLGGAVLAGQMVNL
jgi:hypothetical protein